MRATRLRSRFLAWLPALAAGCGDPTTPGAPPEFPLLREVTARTGIEFVHDSGASDLRLLVETMGGGATVLDFDGDGRPDLYFVDTGPALAREGAKPSRSRLYRNLGGWRFEDVTERAGVAGSGARMGAIAADCDNDGDKDLFVTGVGANCLYRNRGDGTFEDDTLRAGLADPEWSSGATFFDGDRDGDLDLFVLHYVVWDASAQRAHSQSGVPVTPAPDLFEPIGNRLFRNRGDGTFEDVTQAAGLAELLGKGLGVVSADLDDDGDVDLFVANDTERNFVLENLGDGTFRDVGIVSGAAYGSDGRARSGMGVDTADFDGDGRLDVVVTNFQHEPNSIFRNEGGLRFTEVSASSGTAEAALNALGFGVSAADLDLDGFADLTVVNGHIQDRIAEIESGVSWAQAPLCFRGLGNGRFRSALEGQPEEFRRPRVGRGLARADFDDDGDLDLVAGVLGGAPALFENDGGNRRAWLTVRCVGTRRDSTALGTRVVVECGGRRQTDEVRSGGSYLSQSDLRLTFGLGDASTVERVSVRWPDGRTEEARGVAARSHVTFVEGSGLVR